MHGDIVSERSGEGRRTKKGFVSPVGADLGKSQGRECPDGLLVQIIKFSHCQSSHIESASLSCMHSLSTRRKGRILGLLRFPVLYFLVVVDLQGLRFFSNHMACKYPNFQSHYFAHLIPSFSLPLSISFLTIHREHC